MKQKCPWKHKEQYLDVEDSGVSYPHRLQRIRKGQYANSDAVFEGGYPLGSGVGLAVRINLDRGFYSHLPDSISFRFSIRSAAVVGDSLYRLKMASTR